MGVYCLCRERHGPGWATSPAAGQGPGGEAGASSIAGGHNAVHEPRGPGDGWGGPGGPGPVWAGPTVPRLPGGCPATGRTDPPGLGGGGYPPAGPPLAGHV